MSNIQQKEWRNAVAELKDLTVDRISAVEEQSAEVKESIEKINSKLDAIEFQAKSTSRRPKRTTSPKLRRSSRMPFTDLLVATEVHWVRPK